MSPARRGKSWKNLQKGLDLSAGFMLKYPLQLTCERKCWNRQTGTFEVRVSMTCGFKSHLPHQEKERYNFGCGALFLLLYTVKYTQKAPSHTDGTGRGTRDYGRLQITGNGSSAGILRSIKNTQGASSKRGLADSRKGLFSIKIYNVSDTRQRTSVA